MPEQINCHHWQGIRSRRNQHRGYFMKTDIAFFLALGVVMAITYLGMQP